jgi:biopolymer transport protein ExbB/TolQ
LFGRSGDRDGGRDAPSWGQPKKIITTTAAMTEASRKAKEEFEAKQAEKAAADEKKRIADEARAEAQKAARAAKQAAKEAEAQKIRDKKEAVERAAIEEANKAKEEIQGGAAMLSDVIASGARGEALTAQLQVSARLYIMLL